MISTRIVFLAVGLTLVTHVADAQTTAPQSSGERDWRVTVYPILAWVPIDIGIDAGIRSSDGGGGDTGGESAKILDGRFDGAFFAGVTASNNIWRIEGYGLWAGIGGDRPDRPFLEVDVDLIYGSAKLGRRIAPDLYVLGGVRRLAVDYDITLGNLPTVSRKPGVWDPIVGIGWHHVGSAFEWHAAVDGGGFGVGADVDVGASLSVDWKPIPHFGLTAGYNALYLKISDSVARQDVTMKLRLQGPTVGFGLYF